MLLARLNFVVFCAVLMASCGGFDFFDSAEGPAEVSTPDPIAEVGDEPSDSTNSDNNGSNPEDGQNPDPEDGETDPEDGETDPGDSETDPGDGETDPGDGETDPGDGETDPEDGETAPGDGETDPGDGTTEPECNGTALSDFELEDVNPQSASLGDMFSPQQYRGQVSAWYFMHTG